MIKLGIIRVTGSFLFAVSIAVFSHYVICKAKEKGYLC